MESPFVGGRGMWSAAASEARENAANNKRLKCESIGDPVWHDHGSADENTTCGCGYGCLVTFAKESCVAQVIHGKRTGSVYKECGS
eukprot:8297889-Karenia_brevis.AAC.1